jgi:hypothetical protein
METDEGKVREIYEKLAHAVHGTECNPGQATTAVMYFLYGIVKSAAKNRAAGGALLVELGVDLQMMWKHDTENWKNEK